MLAALWLSLFEVQVLHDKNQAHKLVGSSRHITSSVHNNWLCKIFQKKRLFAFSFLSTPWFLLYLFCPLQGIKAHKTESLYDLCLFFNLQGVISAVWKHQNFSPACCFCAIFLPCDLSQSSAPRSGIMEAFIYGHHPTCGPSQEGGRGWSLWFWFLVTVPLLRISFL